MLFSHRNGFPGTASLPLFSISGFPRPGGPHLDTHLEKVCAVEREKLVAVNVMSVEKGLQMRQLQARKPVDDLVNGPLETREGKEGSRGWAAGVQAAQDPASPRFASGRAGPPRRLVPGRDKPETYIDVVIDLDACFWRGGAGSVRRRHWRQLSPRLGCAHVAAERLRWGWMEGWGREVGREG